PAHVRGKGERPVGEVTARRTDRAGGRRMQEQREEEVLRDIGGVLLAAREPQAEPPDVVVEVTHHALEPPPRRALQVGSKHALFRSLVLACVHWNLRLMVPAGQSKPQASARGIPGFPAEWDLP